MFQGHDLYIYINIWFTVEYYVLCRQYLINFKFLVHIQIENSDVNIRGAARHCVNKVLGSDHNYVVKVLGFYRKIFFLSHLSFNISVGVAFMFDSLSINTNFLCLPYVFMFPCLLDFNTEISLYILRHIIYTNIYYWKAMKHKNQPLKH